MGEKGLQNLVDFMVQDIMEMTDEEILAETTPEELAMVNQMHERMMEAILGGSPPKQRQTALRLRGNGFETVELDDSGNVIEPLRCTCGGMIVIHQPQCPFYCLTT
jgi:hypothetical protein